MHKTFKTKLPVQRTSDSFGKMLFTRKSLAYLGPAFLVSVGYIDPGNWATNISGGAFILDDRDNGRPVYFGGLSGHSLPHLAAPSDHDGSRSGRHRFWIQHTDGAAGESGHFKRPTALYDHSPASVHQEHSWGATPTGR
jgi:hypothetical protein